MASNSRLAAVIGTYWTVSITMVFINKHILSGIFSGVDVSFFISGYQCFSAVICIIMTRYVGSYLGFSLQLPTLCLQTLLHPDMLKLSFTFVCSLTLNNLMLKHIEVAFYQVARSFTLIFTILLSRCLLNRSLQMLTIFPCLLIMCGFFMGIYQEDVSGTLSLWGIIYGLLASFTTALCGIYFKKAETLLEGDAFKLAYFNNVISCVMFLPLMYATNQLQAVLESGMASNLSLWALLTVSGVLSLTIGWVSALQIKYTSPLTHHISINAKSITMTVLAVIVYQNSKSFMWWCGSLAVVCGVMWYAVIKMKEEPNPNLDTSVNTAEKPKPVWQVV